VAVSGATVKFQVGLNNTASDQISVTFGGVNLSALLASASSVADVSGALTALGNIDTSIQSVSNSRAKFGTAMNRLEIATSNIQTMRLNLSAANSRIVDVDVATETAAMSRNQVLSQAGVSVLAQANQLPQLAFGLLR
jgi:flagellin